MEETQDLVHSNCFSEEYVPVLFKDTCVCSKCTQFQKLKKTNPAFYNPSIVKRVVIPPDDFNQDLIAQPEVPVAAPVKKNTKGNKTMLLALFAGNKPL